MHFFKIQHMVRKSIFFIFRLIDIGSMHPKRACVKRALHESVDYISTSMPMAVAFDTRKELINFALRETVLSGHYLEFGVCTGGTIQHMAKKYPQLHFHGFDSFEGLPAHWAGSSFVKGTFSLQGKLPKMPKNVILHKGWFNETLPHWLMKNQDDIAFMHIDCDLYASTVDILENCVDRIKEGTIILFDEYFNHPRWKIHEFKAWQEFVAKYQINYDYIGFADTQVAVRVLSRPVGANQYPVL